MMLHKFYPIVPDLSWLERIVPLGVRTVQLRMKNIEEDAVRDQVRLGLQLCRSHNCQLIINDYWKQSIEIGADYIHLGQEDLEMADVAAIKRAGIRLGISTHSHEELETALKVGPDYVALGPIYETTLKKMKWDPQGLDRVREWKSLVSCPLVAIGGINLDRAPAVLAAGADSVAVVTDIVMHLSPEARIGQWLGSMNKLDH